MTARSAVLDPVTPGELLWEEFMSPMGLTRFRLAKEIDVPAQRIGDIVNGKRIPLCSTCATFGYGYIWIARVAPECE